MRVEGSFTILSSEIVMLTPAKFNGDRSKAQVGADMALVMTNQAIQDYIKEQITKNSIEKYIQSMDFGENQRSASTMISTAIISDYPLEESSGAKAVITKARADLSRELGTPKTEIGDFALEAEHQKYQDL